MSGDHNTEKLRIDKWLWAARFYKTRSLAIAAIECGKVLINESRVKPAKEVKVGDMLDINLGQSHFVVEVLGISNKRGAAPIAQTLYNETEESRARREVIAAQLKVSPPLFSFKGRPTKRDRREIERLRKG